MLYTCVCLVLAHCINCYNVLIQYRMQVTQGNTVPLL